MSGKIAFLCLAHSHFDYLQQVSKYYCSDGDGFFLHIDARIDITELSGLHPNTVLLKGNERYKTAWGSYEIIRATLALIKKALAYDDYQHFILISGVDLPLLSKKQLKNYLVPGQSYVSIWHQINKAEVHDLEHEFFQRHHYDHPLTNPGLAYATGSRWRIYPMLLLNKLIALFPLNLSRFKRELYFKGSQWWCVSKAMAEYFIEQLNKAEVEAEFKYMHAPDEKVFQTLAMLSPFKEQLAIDNGQNSLKQGIHYIDWGFAKEKVALQPFDLALTKKARGLNCAFARKLLLNNQIEKQKLSAFIEQLLRSDKTEGND